MCIENIYGTSAAVYISNHHKEREYAFKCIHIDFKRVLMSFKEQFIDCSLFNNENSEVVK